MLRRSGQALPCSWCAQPRGSDPWLQQSTPSPLYPDRRSVMAAHADIPQYRSTVQDALGRPIPDEGELKVWLDDDVEDRAAPEGWTHLVTAREVCFLLLTGRVVELSLDQ